jgi:hypothetical protein
MNRAFFVYEDQSVGIEGAIVVALTADMDQCCAVLAL